MTNEKDLTIETQIELPFPKYFDEKLISQQPTLQPIEEKSKAKHYGLNIEPIKINTKTT